jgi:hypothetical protein
MLRAPPAELAAFRAQMRERYRVPPRASVRKADQAFEILADQIIAYLSSPIPSQPDPGYRVGACIACGKTDCFASAEPWAAPLVYRDGQAFISGGFCCTHAVDADDPEFDQLSKTTERGTDLRQALADRCAHPMVSAQNP